jgi:ParB family chromosome partitioning protein
MIEPIVVRRDGDKYEIIAGHRRYEAAKIAGMTEIPCIIVEGNDFDPDAWKFDENLMREDVSKMDIARYLMHEMKEHGATVEQLAKKFSKTTAWVNSMLSLLNLDPMLQEAVHDGIIPYASALELQKIKDPVARESLTRSAVQGGASHRTIVQWVQHYRMQDDFRQKVESGEYVEPPTIPYEPLKFTCFLCGKKHDTTSMVIVKVNPDCYSVLEQLRYIAVKEGLVNTKEGEHGTGQSVNEERTG